MSSEPWILVDPTHKSPDTFKPIFMDPDGGSTTEPGDAMTFPSEDEAQESAAGRPDQWVPTPLGPYLPKDLIVITEPVAMSGNRMEPVFSIHYIRILNDEDFTELLQGTPLATFNRAHVVVQGEIESHSGQTGSVTIGSVEEAVRLAKAALADGGSEVRRAGFSPDTPIYRFRPGQPLSPA
jgi:hypothetical protein